MKLYSVEVVEKKPPRARKYMSYRFVVLADSEEEARDIAEQQTGLHDDQILGSEVAPEDEDHVAFPVVWASDGTVKRMIAKKGAK